MTGQTHDLKGLHPSCQVHIGCGRPASCMATDQLPFFPRYRMQLPAFGERISDLIVQPDLTHHPLQVFVKMLDAEFTGDISFIFVKYLFYVVVGRYLYVYVGFLGALYDESIYQILTGQRRIIRIAKSRQATDHKQVPDTFPGFALILMFELIIVDTGDLVHAQEYGERGFIPDIYFIIRRIDRVIVLARTPDQGLDFLHISHDRVVPQSLRLQINDKIVQKLLCYRVGVDITIIEPGKPVNVPNDSVVNGGVVCRLASGMLFKYLPGKRREINAFQRLRLPEVVYIVLPRLAETDRL